MKKNIIIAITTAIGLSAITFMRQNSSPDHHTDLQLENIEAIANDEDYSKNCVFDSESKCIYPIYDEHMRIIYVQLDGYRNLLFGL